MLTIVSQRLPKCHSIEPLTDVFSLSKDTQASALYLPCEIECQQDSSNLLSNFSFPISHFNFPNRIATSSFNSFQADHFFFRLSRPFGFSTRPDFWLIELPFQVFNSTPFFFFLKWAVFSGFQLIYFFFLFFFTFFSFHHTFKNSKFAQNGWKISEG